jgi:hypothetical protein
LSSVGARRRSHENAPAWRPCRCGSRRVSFSLLRQTHTLSMVNEPLTFSTYARQSEVTHEGLWSDSQEGCDMRLEGFLSSSQEPKVNLTPIRAWVVQAENLPSLLGPSPGIGPSRFHALPLSCPRESSKGAEYNGFLAVVKKLRRSCRSLRWTPLVRQLEWRVKRESRGIIAPCRCRASVSARTAG